MELIFFIDNERQIGGGEYAQFKFAENLANIGHKVIIFCGDKTFLSDELDKQKNLTIHYKKTIPVMLKKVGIGKTNAVIDKLYTKKIIEPTLKKIIKQSYEQKDTKNKKYLQKKQNENIWLIGYLRKSAIKAEMLGKKYNLEVANFIFESPPWMKEQLGENEWNNEWSSSSFRKSWEKTGYAYTNSTILIPNSNLAGKKCKEWLPQARISEPVYPGIDSSNIYSDKKNKQKTPSRDIDIIYVGRLNSLKNIDEFLFSITPKEKVVIVGQGEEKRNLIRISKENNLNIDFKGAVSEKEKWNLLSRSKLLIFPTSFEGFGMPPMEGLISGCQVLCSNIPILKEIYKNNVHYFKIHDIKDMKKMINFLLKKEVTQKKIPINFIKKFSWENSAKTIEKILKQNSLK